MNVQRLRNALTEAHYAQEAPRSRALSIVGAHMPSEPTLDEHLSRAVAVLDRAELMDLGSAPRGAMRQMAMTLHDAIRSAIGVTRATWPIPDHVGVRLAISEEDLAAFEALLLQGPSAIVLVPLVERLRGDLSDVIHLMRSFQAADQGF